MVQARIVYDKLQPVIWNRINQALTINWLTFIIFVHFHRMDYHKASMINAINDRRQSINTIMTNHCHYYHHYQSICDNQWPLHELPTINCHQLWLSSFIIMTNHSKPSIAVLGVGIARPPCWGWPQVNIQLSIVRSACWDLNEPMKWLIGHDRTIWVDWWMLIGL